MEKRAKASIEKASVQNRENIPDTMLFVCVYSEQIDRIKWRLKHLVAIAIAAIASLWGALQCISYGRNYFRTHKQRL